MSKSLWSVMIQKMKRGLIILLGFIIVAMVVVAVGPRPAIDGTIHFDADSIAIDAERWIADREAAVPDIRRGTQKEIVWANAATRARTPLAIIYVHGFSATKWETRPLPDKVAAALGANLFFTRLTGHGSTGEALAQASMNDWVNDIAEAVAIGERIGERVVIIATSTGATLASWAAGNALMMNKVIGMVLISPNYEVKGASIGLLNMPWGETLLPMIYGDTRSFEPVNEAHRKWWTTLYPSIAVLPIAALMKAVAEIDPGRHTVPAYFILSPNDKIVAPGATRRMYEEWGAAKKITEVANPGDPEKHILAGDILSPATTDMLVSDIVDWIGTLKR